jgi:hypothetical protein
MKAAFPRSKKWSKAAETVGSATVGDIRAAGFEVVPDPTTRFPNHVRLVHADGAAGFTDVNLARLLRAFHNTTGH